MGVSKNCEVCHKPFKKAHGKQVICSDDCRKIRRLERDQEKGKKAREERLARMITKTCECGRQFITSSDKRIRCKHKDCKNAIARKRHKARVLEIKKAKPSGIPEKYLVRGNISNHNIRSVFSEV